MNKFEAIMICKIMNKRSKPLTSAEPLISMKISELKLDVSEGFRFLNLLGEH